MELRVEEADPNGLELLAVMNRQLIEDEGHDNPLDVPKLKVRMESLLRGSYRAYLFMQEEEVRGYALVHHGKTPLYLRQFFICRDCRRQGLGRLAFFKLMETLGTGELDVEVLSWNERGYAFWKSLGFAERSVYLRREGATGDAHPQA